jgi:drug/metabolite transporter (DMT)-like permease
MGTRNETYSRPISLALGVVTANSIGNLALRIGMAQVGVTVSVSPLPYLRALLNPWVLLGVVLLIGWLVLNLALLSRADLTFVLPITSTSYIVAALFGSLILREPIAPVRWIAIFLIAAGAAIVGGDRPRS